LSCRDYYCYILSCNSIAKTTIILFFYQLVEEVMSISTTNQIFLGQFEVYSTYAVVLVMLKEKLNSAFFFLSPP